MRYTQALIDISSSTLAFSDKKDQTDHFKWDSIKKFLYLAFTFSSSSTNFDIFSNIYENVRVIDFLICEMTVGMSYMCMDFFIKQYTKSISFNSSLSPLLKGIGYGILLQSALWTLLHASDLADSIRFLTATFQSIPSWSSCPKLDENVTCVPSKDIIVLCRENNVTNLVHTSAHFNYMKSFLHWDKNVLTTKFFASALVWIFNFFCSSVADETLIKVFKITCIWRFTSTLSIVLLLLISSSQDMATSISKMMDLSVPSSYMNSMDHVTYAYGIGFVGVYDFGTVNSHTMVDNAVIIFSLAFTLNAFARSLIVSILYGIMSSCVQVEISMNPHYLLFSILPLATDFLYAHKMYIIYIYLNLLLATLSYLAMLTLTMAKLLHSEYRSVKNIYIVGLICFLGFCFSIPLTVSLLSVSGLVYGLKVTVLYLGGFKVAIVMWIYGVDKFSTDIKFWLGFKPTKYWTLCWTFMPFVLILAGISKVYTLTKMDNQPQFITAIVWLSLSFGTVLIIQAKTVASFILRNNLAKIFRSSAKYGPPDPDERKRRRLYNETIRLRYCVHNCIVLDETYDCNHLPLANQSRSASTLSLTLSEQPLSQTQNIYTAGVIIHRHSSADGIPYD